MGRAEGRRGRSRREELKRSDREELEKEFLRCTNLDREEDTGANSQKDFGDSLHVLK